MSPKPFENITILSHIFAKFCVVGRFLTWKNSLLSPWPITHYRLKLSLTSVCWGCFNTACSVHSAISCLKKKKFCISADFSYISRITSSFQQVYFYNFSGLTNKTWFAIKTNKLQTKVHFSAIVQLINQSVPNIVSHWYKLNSRFYSTVNMLS